jgi:hypothetical protein
MSKSNVTPFVKTGKGKEWLSAKIRKNYGLKKAAEAKAAARTKAIRRSYALRATKKAA